MVLESDIAAWLERSGWTRSVAGDTDFTTAVQALTELRREPTRGLCLMGCVGVGKTALAEIVFRSVRGEKARIDCADNGAVDWLVPPCDAESNGGAYNSGYETYLAGSLFLDDLGRETIRQSYGNTLDRVGNFLVRYHQYGVGRLLLTTNLNAAELEMRYSARVLDRIFDRCIVAKLTGKSKRNRVILGARI